jgi:hypothetical protein
MSWADFEQDYPPWPEYMSQYVAYIGSQYEVLTYNLERHLQAIANQVVICRFCQTLRDNCTCDTDPENYPVSVHLPNRETRMSAWLTTIELPNRGGRYSLQLHLTQPNPRVEINTPSQEIDPTLAQVRVLSEAYLLADTDRAARSVTLEAVERLTTDEFFETYLSLGSILTETDIELAEPEVTSRRRTVVTVEPTTEADRREDHQADNVGRQTSTASSTPSRSAGESSAGSDCGQTLNWTCRRHGQYRI